MCKRFVLIAFVSTLEMTITKLSQPEKNSQFWAAIQGLLEILRCLQLGQSPHHCNYIQTVFTSTKERLQGCLITNRMH